MWEDTREWLAAHPEVVRVPVEAVREGRVRVAEEPAGPVGFSLVVPLADGAWELDALFVEPAAMGRGVGRALLADAVARARGAAASAIEVTANPNALGFYERAGFERIGVVEVEVGRAVKMRLSL